MADFNCRWGTVRKLPDGSHQLLCRACGRWSLPISGRVSRYFRTCTAHETTAMDSGVGTHLRKIIDTLSVSKRGGCACAQLEWQLNITGPAACRVDRAAIVVHLRKNAKGYGVRDWARAGKAAFDNGMTFIKLTDMLGSLLDEAIRRAEAEQKRKAYDASLRA